MLINNGIRSNTKAFHQKAVFTIYDNGSRTEGSNRRLTFLEKELQPTSYFVHTSLSFFFCTRSQVLRFGDAKYIFMVENIFVFIVCFNKNILGTTKFGGHKNVGGHCPRTPPWLRASLPPLLPSSGNSAKEAFSFYHTELDFHQKFCQCFCFKIAINF